MTVTRLARATPDDWRSLKEVRLRALADAPGAFASTLAREEAFGDDEWRRWLAQGATFVAWADDQPVGVVTAFAEPDPPEQSHLVGMWVAPEQRGTSTADRLVQAVLDWAAGGGATSVVLWVVDGNDRARRFYERMGFRPTGRRQPLPSNPAVGEEKLERRLG